MVPKTVILKHTFHSGDSLLSRNFKELELYFFLFLSAKELNNHAKEVLQFKEVL